MEQESHPYQHFADRPIIDRDLVPLYDLTPAAYQRIVNDLAHAFASDAGAMLMEYTEDVVARVQALAPQGPPPPTARRISGQRCRRPVQVKHRRPPVDE